MKSDGMIVYDFSVSHDIRQMPLKYDIKLRSNFIYGYGEKNSPWPCIVVFQHLAVVKS